LDLNEIEIARKLKALRPWYFLGLFIKVQNLNLANKITISCDNLLQPPLILAACPLGGVLGEVAEDLHEGDDQGLLSIMGGSVDISLRDATHERSQQIRNRSTGRPDLSLSKKNGRSPLHLLRVFLEL
jgi:hypothetical protein